MIQAYHQKYDWDFQVSQYGELTEVEPMKVLAWRTAGWAGHDNHWLLVLRRIELGPRSVTVQALPARVHPRRWLSHPGPKQRLGRKRRLEEGSPDPIQCTRCW